MFAGCIAIQTAIFFRCIVINGSINGQNIDLFKVVTIANFSIVEIMGWSDFDTTTTKFRIDIVITDDRNFTAHQWQSDGFADQLFIAFIFRMYRNSRITEHGFRTGSGHHQMTATIG